MLFTKNLTITAEKAYQLMLSGREFVLLDVRSPAEYQQRHISGAKLIPVSEIIQRASAELPDKEKLILVYCHSGMRAETAAKQLDRMGYKNVFTFGGIVNWPYGMQGGEKR